jgi:linoleoyl-CoA desaturase
MNIATPHPASEIASPSTASSAVVPIAKQQYVKSLPFTGRMGFRKALNERVDAYMQAQRLKARDLPAMYAKSVVILLWWAASYALWMYSGVAGWHWATSIAFAVSFGLAAAGIGFNIMHDANHNGYSDNPLVNRILGYSAEVVGLSAFIWRQQHNVWHHTYTNIAGLDEGLETDGWLRSSPKDVWVPKHRFQHLYAPVVYAMAGVGLIILRNFAVYFTGKSSEHFVYPKMSRHDKITFWIGRAFNILLYFVLPALVFPWYMVMAGFVAFTFTAGSVMAHILMLAHIATDVEFVEPVGDPLHIDNEWAIHQVITSMNFSPKNALMNWYVGGLNFQIEHHLFPQMCHVVYPKIAHIVEETCREFGVRYVSKPNFFRAVQEHYVTLKEFGRQPAAA